MDVTDVSALTTALYGERFDEVHGLWRRLFASPAFDAEGDNLPIWLKAAGRMMLGDPLPPPPPAPPVQAVTDPLFLRHLMACLEHVWDRRARTALERCADPDPLARWNAATNPALELVAARAQRLAGDAMLAAAADAPDTGQDLLHLLHRLFALRRIYAHSGSLIAAGHLAAEHVEQFPALYDEAVARLVPYALPLVDAFAIPEEILRRCPILGGAERPGHDGPGTVSAARDDPDGGPLDGDRPVLAGGPSHR